MIVIEGMDNTGKTTLLTTLHSALELPWVKSPGPEHLSGLSRNDWFEWIRTSFSPDHCFHLFDRHPLISEPVYGKVLRGFNVFEETDFLKAFHRAHPLIIYCRPPRERIFSFGNREQMIGVIDYKDVLLKTYDDYIKELIEKDFDIVTYNYTTTNIDTIMKLITRYLDGISTLKVVK